MPRKCARPGCDNPIQTNWFACKPDWYALPRELRHAVFNAYQQGNYLRSPEYTAAIRRVREFWDHL